MVSTSTVSSPVTPLTTASAMFTTCGPNSAANHGGGHNITAEEQVHYVVESLQYLVEHELVVERSLARGFLVRDQPHLGRRRVVVLQPLPPRRSGLDEQRLASAGRRELRSVTGHRRWL